VDLQEKMPKIQAEVLLVYGDRDTATPVLYGQIMEQKIPGSGLAVIQNAGHFAFADNWPQFKAVMEAFL
jgi:pimeloyl-ACP methyl ester carboxylesterase